MKCEWCGQNVGKGHKVNLCKKYNKPAAEMEAIRELVKEADINTKVIKTLELAKEAILAEVLPLSLKMEHVLAEINPLLDLLLGIENEDK